jgi:synaptobrevin family protein YKT6
VAFVLLGQILDDFTNAFGDTWKSCTEPDSMTFPKLHEYLQKYQNPSEADKIRKIQKDLDDTKEIVHKTIDSILERGVKLDALVERSNDLSAQSKMFYKQAKKTNTCCVIS